MSKKIEALNNLVKYARSHGFPFARIGYWDEDGQPIESEYDIVLDSHAPDIGDVALHLNLGADVYVAVVDDDCGDTINGVFDSLEDAENWVAETHNESQEDQANHDNQAG